MVNAVSMGDSDTGAGGCRSSSGSSRHRRAALAARLTADLRKEGRLGLVKELARLVGRGDGGCWQLTDDEAADYDTLIEYCLFARYNGAGGGEGGGEGSGGEGRSRRPLVAHYNPSGWRASSLHLFLYSALLCAAVLALYEEYESEANLLCELVGAWCAEEAEFRGTVSATVFWHLLATCCHRDPWKHTGFLSRLLTRHGKHLAPATHLNLDGENGLTVFCTAQPLVLLEAPDDDVYDVRRRSAREVLAAFMDHVPQARDAVNTRHPVHGYTVAHDCVRANALNLLAILALDYGADISKLKDNKGRTVLDLAEMYGIREDVQKLIPVSPAPTLPSSSPSSSGRLSLAGAALDGFPKIYLPSEPDLKPSETNRIMLEYLRSELPQLLHMDPGLVVVPPIADDAEGDANRCPYRQDSSGARGWMAEMRVVRTVKLALEGLRQDIPDLHVACFHGLRYGCELQRQGSWETDFDVAVMCCRTEENTASQFQALVLVFEIKSITQARDFVRDFKPDGSLKPTTGTHALDQLCNHFDAFSEHIGVKVIGPEWTIPILAAPSFPSTAACSAGNQKVETPTKEEGDLQEKWKKFLEAAANSNDERVARYSKIKPQLLTSFSVNNAEVLKAWLKTQLNSAAVHSTTLSPDEVEERRTGYATILAWCVAHCMGVAVQHVSQSIDEETAQQLTLMTLQQREAYDRGLLGDRRPLLIVGAAGTGKTLLALAKLLRCEEDGLINADKRGLFLTHSRNTALISLVREQLRRNQTKFIEVMPLGPGQVRNLKQELIQMLENESFSFVVIDQLEDMFPGKKRSDIEELTDLAEASREMLKSLTNLTCFDMLWVTLNPRDLLNIAAEWAVSSHLRNCLIRNTAGNVLQLNRRIRNTREISAKVSRCEAQYGLSPSLNNAADPIIGITDSSSTTSAASAGGGPSVFAEYFEQDEDGAQAATLAKVLHNLLLGTGIKDKHILVLDVVEDHEAKPCSEKAICRLMEMDKALLAAGFCKPGNKRVPSLAPLLICAAWSGDEEEALKEKELIAEVQGHLQRLASEQNNDLWNTFQLIYAGTSGIGEWLEELPEEVVGSFAFQAAISLITRAVNSTSLSCMQIQTGKADKDKDKFKQEVEDAIRCTTDSDPGAKLRRLIARHRCISLLNHAQVNGYEADVVVFNHFHKAFDSQRGAMAWQVLSRAKVMAVLIPARRGKVHIDYVLGSLPALFIAT